VYYIKSTAAVCDYNSTLMPRYDCIFSSNIVIYRNSFIMNGFTHLIYGKSANYRTSSMYKIKMNSL